MQYRRITSAGSRRMGWAAVCLLLLVGTSRLSAQYAAWPMSGGHYGRSAYRRMPHVQVDPRRVQQAYYEMMKRRYYPALRRARPVVRRAPIRRKMRYLPVAAVPAIFERNYPVPTQKSGQPGEEMRLANGEKAPARLPDVAGDGKFDNVDPHRPPTSEVVEGYPVEELADVATLGPVECAGNTAPPRKRLLSHLLYEVLVGHGRKAYEWAPPFHTLTVDMESLNYWIRPQRLGAPLVALGATGDNPPGALGQPGTVGVIQGDDLSAGRISGGRFRVRKRDGLDTTTGTEVSGFLTEEKSRRFTFGSNAAGVPTLAFPVIRAELGREGAFLISDAPRGLTGSVSVEAASRLWGATALRYATVIDKPDFSLEMLAGYRYLTLEERLQVQGRLFSLNLNLTDNFNDRFETDNEFHGGVIGCRARKTFGRWEVSVRTTIAAGNMHQVVNASGNNTLTAGGVTAIFNSGLFVLPSNRGSDTTDRFAILPEVQAKVSYAVTPFMRLIGGYDALYLSSAARAAEQVDRSINRTQRQGGVLVGPARPGLSVSASNFWLHGFNMGLEWLY